MNRNRPVANQTERLPRHPYGPLIALIGSLLISCSGAGLEIYFPAPETQGGWRKNTGADFVRSLGLNPERLEEFGRYNLSVPNGTWTPYSNYQGILVIKNGWIVGEWYNVPEAQTFPTYLSSNGKAVSIAAFGMVLEDVRLGSLPFTLSESSPLYDRRWLPEGFPLSDARKEGITFEHVFQHTSGLCPERTASGEDVEAGRDEWTDYVSWVVGQAEQWPQTARLYFPPGHIEGYEGKERSGQHYQAYSSVAFCHIGLVLESIYGQPAHQFIWDRLLQPLGFGAVDYHSPPDSKHRWFSAGGLRMTPRDYARFAYFLIHDGRWGDQQLVQASWIQKFRNSSRYANIRSNVDGVFGDQYPAEMFRIAGSGLNWAFMIPSKQLIAVRTGRASNSRWQEVEKKFLEHLFQVLD